MGTASTLDYGERRIEEPQTCRPKRLAPNRLALQWHEQWLDCGAGSRRRGRDRCASLHRGSGTPSPHDLRLHRDNKTWRLFVQTCRFGVSTNPSEMRPGWPTARQYLHAFRQSCSGIVAFDNLIAAPTRLHVPISTSNEDYSRIHAAINGISADS